MLPSIKCFNMIFTKLNCVVKQRLQMIVETVHCWKHLQLSVQGSKVDLFTSSDPSASEKETATRGRVTSSTRTSSLNTRNKELSTSWPQTYFWYWWLLVTLHRKRQWSKRWQSPRTLVSKRKEPLASLDALKEKEPCSSIDLKWWKLNEAPDLTRSFFLTPVTTGCASMKRQPVAPKLLPPDPAIK